MSISHVITGSLDHTSSLIVVSWVTQGPEGWQRQIQTRYIWKCFKTGNINGGWAECQKKIARKLDSNSRLVVTESYLLLTFYLKEHRSLNHSILFIQQVLIGHVLSTMWSEIRKVRSRGFVYLKSRITQGKRTTERRLLVHSSHGCSKARSHPGLLCGWQGLSHFKVKKWGLEGVLIWEG